MHDYIELVAAGCYLLATGLLYSSLLGGGVRRRSLSQAAALAGVLLHAVAQYQHWFPAGPAEISFLTVLSLSALVVVACLLLSIPAQHSLFDAGLVALPLAAVVLLFEALSDAPGLLLDAAGPATSSHIVSSVLAFGLFCIAAVYALFVALIDWFLRHHHLNPLLRALPALETLEALLFRLILAGFAFLTISLATGLLFVDDLFAQHLAHKTILSFLAWLLFGVLLWGRWARGWRGRTAVRLTIAGVALLVLGYFGSKLVLEVLLGRSWQT